jgi:hypothetical protein
VHRCARNGVRNQATDCAAARTRAGTRRAACFRCRFLTAGEDTRRYARENGHVD